MGFNPLNAELNPVCHLLALLGAHHILHVGRIRVNSAFKGLKIPYRSTVSLFRDRSVRRDNRNMRTKYTRAETFPNYGEVQERFVCMSLSFILTFIARVHKFQTLGLPDDYILYGGAKQLWAHSMELASYQPTSA